MPQGKLIKRQRLPKNDQGDYWHWKDLNIDINVTFYGKIFHITDCDKWTKVNNATNSYLNPPPKFWGLPVLSISLPGVAILQIINTVALLRVYLFP